MDLIILQRNKFWKFILNLISFNSPLAIIINLSLIIFILLIIPTYNLQYLPTCSLYNNFIIPVLFNNSCPSQGIFTNCGFYSIGQTRALSNLLHGNFLLAYKFNKLVIILFIVILVVWIVNVIKVYKKYKKSFSLNFQSN